MFDFDWQSLLVPSGSVLEIMVRGTVVYLTLFACFRLLPRRTLGGLGPSDLLIIVLIADAVQNAMGNNYESVSEGLVLAATIIGWSQVIDWLDYRLPHLNLASAAPRPLIRDGRILRRNLAREQITEEELMSELRQQGLESTEEVRLAFIEGDGRFSVLRRRGAARLHKPREKPAT